MQTVVSRQSITLVTLFISDSWICLKDRIKHLQQNDYFHTFENNIYGNVRGLTKATELKRKINFKVWKKFGAVFSKTQHRRRFAVRLVYFCTKLSLFATQSYRIWSRPFPYVSIASKQHNYPRNPLSAMNVQPKSGQLCDSETSRSSHR